MTSSTTSLLRFSALALTAVLTLAACSSNDDGDAPSAVELGDLKTPEVTEQETALAETLLADFPVTQAMTLPEQWPDLTAMATALTGTAEPDLCQQAGAEQYGLLVNAQPANVRAVFDDTLDEQASAETVTVFYGNNEASPEALQQAHQHTDTQCVEDYESAVDHQTTETTVNGTEVTVHTWQVVASGQLTGRMVDVVDDEVFIRYAAAYPPHVMAEELEDDAAETFTSAATERALEVFAVATQ